MPTYQYACRSCDHRFEAVQGFHDNPLRECPACSAEDLRKLFGNVGVVFKGSGFYRTDSRADRGKSKTGSSTSAKSDSSSTAKADAKAATTSSTKTD